MLRYPLHIKQSIKLKFSYSTYASHTAGKKQTQNWTQGHPCQDHTSCCFSTGNPLEWKTNILGSPAHFGRSISPQQGCHSSQKPLGFYNSQNTALAPQPINTAAFKARSIATILSRISSWDGLHPSFEKQPPFPSRPASSPTALHI